MYIYMITLTYYIQYLITASISHLEKICTSQTLSSISIDRCPYVTKILFDYIFITANNCTYETMKWNLNLILCKCP